MTHDDEAWSRSQGVVGYNPLWRAHFRVLADAVDRALSGMPHTTEHTGSTSVPGVAAKPIIDLFAVIESKAAVAPAIAALGRAGWPHEGDGGVPGRDCFVSRADLPYHHLYVVVRGSHQHQVQIQFRDILRTQAVAREEYAALKLRLAPLLSTDRAAYTVAVDGAPRHLETALAMGFAVDEQSSWPSGYVTGEVEHHGQWRWDEPFVRYAALTSDHRTRVAMAAAEHLRAWLRIVERIPAGASAALVWRNLKRCGASRSPTRRIPPRRLWVGTPGDSRR